MRAWTLRNFMAWILALILLSSVALGAMYDQSRSVSPGLEWE